MRRRLQPAMNIFIAAQKKIRALLKQIDIKRPTIILGFSGGPDSLFLLHVLHALEQEGQIYLIAAHFDHEWRPASGADLLFCKETCQNLGIRFYNGRPSTLTVPIKKNGSQEEFGRNMRRAFFSQIVQEVGGGYVALAHHFQDQQETFFIRLIRGATLSGLVGMRAIDGFYIRPLLEFNKNDFITYLDEHKITYLTDPTNISPAFLRNRIRATLLPALHTLDQRFEAKFASTLRFLAEEESYLALVAHQKFKECFNKIDTGYIGDCKKLMELHPVILRRVVLEWCIASSLDFSPSEGFLGEIIRFVMSPRGGSHACTTTWSIAKKKHRILFERRQE